MTHLIDLESLRTSNDAASCHLHDEWLDALAGDLAELICPTEWHIFPDADAARDQCCQPDTSRYELPDGYSFPADTQLVADLEQLIAGLQLVVHRAKRDRWLSQVVALPA